MWMEDDMTLWTVIMADSFSSDNKIFVINRTRNVQVSFFLRLRGLGLVNITDYILSYKTVRRMWQQSNFFQNKEIFVQFDEELRKKTFDHIYKRIKFTRFSLGNPIKITSKNHGFILNLTFYSELMMVLTTRDAVTGTCAETGDYQHEMYCFYGLLTLTVPETEIIKISAS